MSAVQPARYSGQPLPAYRHVPGITPHPLRDPEGHSFGQHTDPDGLPDLNHAPPNDSGEFLFGIDLFNNGYWWECHEVFEGLWRAAGPGTTAAHILQAVIQCAAAHLKTDRDGPSAVARHLFAQAERHVHQAGDRDLGLDMIGLLADTGAFATGDTEQPAQLVLHSV